MQGASQSRKSSFIVAVQNFKSMVVQLLIEVLLHIPKGTDMVYDLCKSIHSILVEDTAVIYQVHLQTYSIAILETMITNVESLHVIIARDGVNMSMVMIQIQHHFQQLLDLYLQGTKMDKKLRRKIQKNSSHSFAFHLKAFSLLI